MCCNQFAQSLFLTCVEGEKKDCHSALNEDGKGSFVLVVESKVYEHRRCIFYGFLQTNKTKGLEKH